MAGDISFTAAGGANSIGTSCYYFKFGATTVAVDYGGGFGKQLEPDDLGRPDWLLVTHAHFDHAGMVPRALLKWPQVRILATRETVELADWVWEDAIRVSQRLKRPAPYTERDISAVNRRIKRCLPGEQFTIGRNLTVRVLSAGHILGAASFLFTYGDRTVFVTGDISLRRRGLIGAADELSLGHCDLLVRESTYVGLHPENTYEEQTEALAARVFKIVGDGGQVVIPTLSIDRMQEVALALHRRGVQHLADLYLVGGESPTSTYVRNLPDAFALTDVPRLESIAQQQHIMRYRKPAVIIASSGMVMPGTPSYSWVTSVLERPDCAVLFVNWQNPTTPGGALLKSQHGEWVVMPDNRYRRRCLVERFDLSSHMKEDEAHLLEQRLHPATVIHVHGEDQRIQTFLDARAGIGPQRIKSKVGREVII